MSTDQSQRARPGPHSFLSTLWSACRDGCGFFAAAIVFLVLVVASPASADSAIGGPAPSFSGKDLDGTSFDLANLKGKTVLIHFWATWCPSCREEMGVIDAYLRAHTGDALQVIAVSTDKPKHRDEVETLMKPLAFPSAMTSDLTANGFGDPRELPVTYVIDPNGNLIARITPEKEPLSAKVLERTVGPLLHK